MRINFLKCSRGLVVFVFLVAVVSGCSVVDSFHPETLQIEAGEIRIKGWVRVEKSRFCVDIRLKPTAKNTTLHSLNLVLPDGSKLSPNSWKDKTSPPPQMGFSFGFGGGGGGHHPHDEGGGSRIATGASIPLKKDSKRTATHVRACWELDERLRGVDISKCDLEINLICIERKKITMETLLLIMAYHPLETPEKEKNNEEKKKTAKELIHEIDFTQKHPPQIRSLKV